MDQFIQVEGLRTRYVEAGSGPPVLLVHGASLGSSLDTWEPVLGPLTRQGFRTIAFDQPGYGLTDEPTDWSFRFRRHFLQAFLDAFNLPGAHLVGHSQAGAMAVEIAIEHPRVATSVVALGTGSLLPPQPVSSQSKSGKESAHASPVVEPTLEDTRRDLEANLFNPALITRERLMTRHRMSVGKNFRAALRRQETNSGGLRRETPLWQRLVDVPVPVLLIYGRQDRGSAAQRAELARQLHPSIKLQVLESGKHLIHWDRAAAVIDLIAGFIGSHQAKEGTLACT